MLEPEDWLNAATPGRYYSYIVRIWQTDPQSGWRASVEAIGSSERYTFTALAEFQRFLCQSIPPIAAGPAGCSESIRRG